ncbi:uncharacterized protein TNCV_414531 [Trichonephila clavipes]|nr:uncharacterized protein TNCV_414531 [Trichonephila clavipes]
MTEAADEVRKLKNTSDVAKCGVSVDGTWQRRGHSSLNSCVAVLSIDTGKVLNLEVMSKWCRNCNTSKNSGKSKHVKKHQCSYNHQGSAGSMESVGAYRLFERSRETMKLEYVEFYGDGDSKSHLAVTDIYGIDSTDSPFSGAVSTSATLVFTIDALPDCFLSVTDPMSRNRCCKSVIIDAFGAVSPEYFSRNAFITRQRDFIAK